MDIAAVYKTWDGGEFVDASLASIYDSVSSIVMVHSEISWLGERGNTVREPAIRWCEQFDKDSKVHHVEVELTSQEQQYQAAIDYISQRKLPCDVVMVVDADEVWEAQYIENAVRQISDNPFVAYRSNMHTYLKTPFFRVAPPYGSPTVFLREPKHLTESPRACKAPALQLGDVWLHHYTYVRESRALVERKLRQSCLADGNEQIVDGWMGAVYDRLPEGKNLHGFDRWRHVWKRIEKIPVSDLPPAIRKAELLPLWLPEGELLDGEVSAIHRLSQGRYRAVDLGTYQGLSAVTLALACREVHTFDCYDDLPPNSFADTIDPKRYANRARPSLERNQELAARFGNITAGKSRSVDAAKAWRRGLVDVLFVDDDHSESAVLADVTAWLPHMQRGAVLIFHDNNELHPGVQTAVGRLRHDPRLKFVDCGKFSGSLCACEVL